ncbi:MAG: hypothetical protein R3292_14900 [Alcanivorax sp.]|nr:hypothetical protein [Alcanivorax sp.]
MFMRATLLLLAALSAAPAWAQQWVKVTDRDGIQVFRAHDDNSRIKTFRGKTLMAVDDFNAIGVLMDDYQAVAGFLHMVSEVQDIHRYSPYKRDVYVTTKLPWPVHDRDAPLRVRLYQEPDSLALMMPFTLNPGAKPERQGYVRIVQMQGYFRFQPVKPGEVAVTLEVVLDPGGALPAWLANIILRDIPYFSLKRLRRVINLPRYQGIDLGYYKTPPGWAQPGEQTAAASASPASPAPSGPR